VSEETSLNKTLAPSIYSDVQKLIDMLQVTYEYGSSGVILVQILMRYYVDTYGFVIVEKHLYRSPYRRNPHTVEMLSV